VRNVFRNSNFIGKSNWNADPYANAGFDELRIYKRALSATEINADMATSSFLNLI
jgi:hypothetical protein